MNRTWAIALMQSVAHNQFVGCECSSASTLTGCWRSWITKLFKHISIRQERFLMWKTPLPLGYPVALTVQHNEHIQLRTLWLVRASPVAKWAVVRCKDLRLRRKICFLDFLCFLKFNFRLDLDLKLINLFIPGKVQK